MKPIKINIPLNILIAVIFIFSMCLWGQEKPNKEELEQLRAAKTAQILLEEWAKTKKGTVKNLDKKFEIWW